MKIQIDLRSWIISNLFTQIITFPFAYVLYPVTPFEVGMACGIALTVWLVILIFWLGKRNGIEIK